MADKVQNRQEAECLGEANWLEPDEARLWLQLDEASPRCYRPEQIAVTVADESPIVVRSSRFKGALAEVEVEHEQEGSKLYYVRYPIEGEAEASITVATTRPRQSSAIQRLPFTRRMSGTKRWLARRPLCQS